MLTANHQKSESNSPKSLKVASKMRSPLRVIVADDHKEMRKLLIQLLCRQRGIQVVGKAANGQEALELSRQLKPDVVVMDVAMNVMSGVEATRRIKAEMPEVRVIGLSMYEDEFIERIMRYAGAESFLSKAGSLSGLLAAIYSEVG